MHGDEVARAVPEEVIAGLRLPRNTVEQADLYDGTTGGRVDTDAASVALLDDAPGDVEPQTGVGLLRGEEGVEGTAGHHWCHSRTAVGDLDEEVLVVPPDRHPQGPHTVHGVQGVVDDVRPDLVELPGVGLDHRNVGVVLAQDRDT